MIAVVLDRRRARFFDVSNGAAVELPGTRSPATEGGRYHSDREDAPGGGEKRYHNRLEEEERRHFEAITQRIAALTGERPGEQLLVAGPGTAATNFRRALPQDLAQRVIGSARLNPARVTPARVQAVARAAAARHELDEQAHLLTAVDKGVGTGYATNGARETLRAIAKGQVRVLLVREDVQGSEEAVQAAADQGATVVVIRDPALAKRVDGLAALLRYAEEA
jgi:peptide subunit release factor 1 (eRF1)